MLFLLSLRHAHEWGGRSAVQGAEELALLSEGPAIAEMLGDYAVLREQARACR